MSEAASSSAPSATTTSQLGSAVPRKRHREEHVQYAYVLQRDAAVKGMIIWTFIGAGTCFFAHHLFPGFRRQTLALKGFLTSGASIFGLCTGAEAVLQHHETQQRSEENLIRNRARTELGKQGIVASEAEIERWKVEERAKLIQRLTRERQGQQQQPSQAVEQQDS